MILVALIFLGPNKFYYQCVIQKEALRYSGFLSEVFSSFSPRNPLILESFSGNPSLLRKELGNQPLGTKIGTFFTPVLKQGLRIAQVITNKHNMKFTLRILSISHENTIHYNFQPYKLARVFVILGTRGSCIKCREQGILHYCDKISSRN